MLLPLSELESNIIIEHLFIIGLVDQWTLHLLLMHVLFVRMAIKYFDAASFDKILQLGVCHIVPVLEPAEQIADTHYAELLVVHLQVTLVAMGIQFGFATVITIVRIVVV